MDPDFPPVGWQKKKASSIVTSIKLTRTIASVSSRIAIRTSNYIMMREVAVRSPTQYDYHCHDHCHHFVRITIIAVIILIVI